MSYIITLAVTVASGKNELVLEPNLSVNAVGPRGQAYAQLKLGRGSCRRGC